MDVRFTLYSILIILIIGTGYCLADVTGNLTHVTSGTSTNSTDLQSETNVTPGEELLNFALDARAYALENGKMAAISSFSDKSSYIRNGMYIAAYDYKGVLLADPYQSDKVGSICITDDHDPGIVRQLRDLAQAGGGMLTTGENGTPVSYYVCKIDGRWWIAAASGRAPSQT